MRVVAGASAREATGRRRSVDGGSTAAPAGWRRRRRSAAERRTCVAGVEAAARSAAERRSSASAQHARSESSDQADEPGAEVGERRWPTAGDAALVADRRRRQHRRRRSVELVGADVELAVAEAVDPQHLGERCRRPPRAAAAPCPASAASGSTAAPSSARSTPLQRWAAAGANTSRPANVAPGAASW